MAHPLEQTKSFPVIIVEDDDDLREAIGITLRMKKIEFVTHQKAETVLPLLQPGMRTILISDYRLPGMTGLDLLNAAKKLAPDLPVVIMTAFADTKLAVEALKAGARDFLIKPFVPDQLIEIIARHQSSGDELIPTVETSKIQENSPSIIAVDPSMLATLTRCDRVATTDTSILITGESGVGKEIIARRIHDSSKRVGGPYIALNCAAIPESLLESILFGHEKGSFTGATKVQTGKFEQANGGTLFLDEIGEMPIQLQAKLLRVLQDKIVERLGSAESVKADVRVIAATNLNLQDQVKKGKFREDLYFRLAVFPILVPELRNRQEDILPLAEFFLNRYRINLGRESIQLGPDAKKYLQSYSWPGNVRELENTIQRSVLLCDGDVITIADLELDDNNYLEGAKPVNFVKNTINLLPDTKNGMFIAETSSKSLEAVEREHILKILIEVNGSRKKAVEILKISDRALRYKLKSYHDKGYFND
jgi:two-component system response regulator FlrC